MCVFDTNPIFARAANKVAWEQLTETCLQVGPGIIREARRHSFMQENKGIFREAPFFSGPPQKEWFKRIILAGRSEVWRPPNGERLSGRHAEAR